MPLLQASVRFLRNAILLIYMMTDYICFLYRILYDQRLAGSLQWLAYNKPFCVLSEMSGDKRGYLAMISNR